MSTSSVSASHIESSVNQVSSAGQMNEREATDRGLRDLLRLMGISSRQGGAAQESNQDREMPEHPAELLDTHTLDVRGASALPIAAFVDGIQTSLRLGYREHRPVYLNYVAAGAVAPNTSVVASFERLDVVCTVPDAQWLRENGCTLSIVELDEEVPYKVTMLASQKLAGARSKLESRVAKQALKATKGYIVIDGHLFGYDYDERLIGVVKSTNTRYLADESILWNLEQGWRSPRFLLDGVKGGREDSAQRSRISAYLRLMDATASGWDFGLIRVESWNRDLIDGACAMALKHRLAPGEYNRWDRHLRGVANVEKILKASRPTVFDLF